MTKQAMAVGAVAGAIASTIARSSSFGRPRDADGIATAAAAAPPPPPNTTTATTATTSRGNGKDVGILAMEVYTPRTYVAQAALETHSGVSPGRYTIGLGQDGLAITGDAEDVNSMALTVVHSLLEKYEINPNDVGRLEVGTETLIDKSKSTKTVLMDLFPNNPDVEGVTVINACYGGTAALLNAFAWVESDGWDGRYAIVVAVDIATYARGPARPTCGAGAVAMLIGRDAPLSFVDPRERSTYATNVYDFYKPDHAVEYPTVDGMLSQTCYYRALEDCYARFCDRVDALNGIVDDDDDDDDVGRGRFHADAADYFVFHAPYNKLVQKSYGRMHYVDARRKYARGTASSSSLAPGGDVEEKKDDVVVVDVADDGGIASAETDDVPRPPPPSPFADADLIRPIEGTYTDRALENIIKSVSKTSYAKRLSDANAASKVVGNTYTASVFFGLASLVDRAGSRGDLTPGKTAVVFSYGSGAIATMYRLHVREPTGSMAGVGGGNGTGRVFTIAEMARKLDLTGRLATREEVHPQELDLALETRARMHRGGAPYSPVYPTIGRMFPGEHPRFY
jgi:hydroxymethylglutaryl-CoA synthase